MRTTLTRLVPSVLLPGTTERCSTNGSATPTRPRARKLHPRERAPLGGGPAIRRSSAALTLQSDYGAGYERRATRFLHDTHLQAFRRSDSDAESL